MNNVDELHTDTIVACATPPGRGGIGVVRVSGQLVKHIAASVLNKTILLQPRCAIFSNFLDHDKNVIDQGIAIFFSSPHSFTGEDVLELHGHGGPVILDNIIKRITRLGARLARPGEFSERAFLNGKIDLIQAEAIADLIDATSTQAAQCAARSLRGEFSRRIRELNQQITQLRVNVEAAIDFAEEDSLETFATTDLRQSLAKILQSLHATQLATQQGVALQEGISVVIAGKPNVGKSSLLNCLSGEERAIVTPIAGTTRDIIRAQVKYNGMMIELLDTAGLRDDNAADEIEREGIRRTQIEVKKTQYILLVVDCIRDANKTPQQLYAEHFAKLNLMTPQPKNLILVYNKIDLANQLPEIIVVNGVNCVFISAKHHQGIDLLHQLLKNIATVNNQTTEGIFSARRRHLIALSKAAEHLLNIQALLTTTANLELIAEELRMAQQYLGEITGEVTSEDLLSLIFSEFCIGK